MCSNAARMLLEKSSLGSKAIKFLQIRIAPKRACLFLAINFSVLLIAELALRYLAEYGLFKPVQYATSGPAEHFLGDIDPDFGVWHYPNRSVTHTTPCFSAEYTSNSYGARDRERDRDSAAQNRVVVLGDSFVEGYGVNSSDRMTDIAEQLSGAEFLNFGVSGNFGAIQQWLLYQKLASQFEHNAVAIFFLPANDFEDNEPSNFPDTRYRPYLSGGNSAEFKVVYPVAFSNREQPRPLSRGRVIRRTLYNNIYLLNLVRQFGEIVEQSEFKNDLEDIAKRQFQIPYEAYSALDLQRLLFAYEKIVELAQGRKVTIYITPTKADLLSYENGLYPYAIVTALQAFAARFVNVEVVDLLPEFISFAQKHKLDFDEFTQKCDAHWSPLGNRVAGLVLARTV